MENMSQCSNMGMALFSEKKELLFSTEAVEMNINGDLFSKTTEDKIFICNDDKTFFSLFLTGIEKEKYYIIVSSKMIFLESVLSLESLQDYQEYRDFKQWLQLMYSIFNKDKSYSFDENIDFPIMGMPLNYENIEQNKAYKILNEKDSDNYLCIVHLISAILSCDKERTNLFLSKYMETIYLNYSEDQIQSIKYNIVILVSLIAREVIIASVFDILNIRSVVETFIADVDKLKTREELFFALKVFIFKGMGLFKKNKEYSLHVQEALQLINRNIYNEITVAEICSILYLDPSYLSTLFKKEVGISMKDYIQKKRIEEAKLLLKHTDTSISEISEMLNFYSVGYFTKVFKKYTHESPKTFKRNNVIHI